MRTHEEIASFAKAFGGKDPFRVAIDVLVTRLPLEYARPWLKPEVTIADWPSPPLASTREQVLAEMRDYMPFAIEKIRNERGISMMRSGLKFHAWLWLIGDDELSDAVADDYREHTMRRIAEKYDLPIEAK